MHTILAVKFFQLADGVFVDGVDKEENFEALLFGHFDEGRVLGSNKRFTSKIVNRLLVFGHTCVII